LNTQLECHRRFFEFPQKYGDSIPGNRSSSLKVLDRRGGAGTASSFIDLCFYFIS
jgi:hypothetical protein